MATCKICSRCNHSIISATVVRWNQFNDMHWIPVREYRWTLDWTLEWHEVLHTWNERAAHFVGIAKIQSWSRICCGAYWKLAAHITKLPIHHWIQRVLHWQPVGPRRLGRPKHRWDSKHCRYQRLGRWEDTAQDFEVWKQQLNGFLDFCSQ